MPSTRAVELKMDTQEFIHIWKEAVSRPVDEDPSQMDYMVDQCIALFILGDNDYSRSNVDFFEAHPHSSAAEMAAMTRVVAKRVYSKCSNLRTKFKKAGYNPPPFPKSGPPKSEKSINDFAKLMGLARQG